MEVNETISNETSIADQNLPEIQFPVEAIEGLAKEFADIYSEYLESPWEYWAFSFLTCLGSVLGEWLTIDSSLSVQPRLYTVLIGQSADDRKSQCIKQTINLFSEVFPRDFDPCLGVGSAEGLVKWMEKHSTTLLVFDEFKSLIEKANIPGSVLLECVNTLFEDNWYHSHTKNQSVEIEDGLLSILSASTEETFSQIWTPKTIDLGLLNRFWLVTAKAEKKFPIPQTIPKKKTNGLQKRLASIIMGASKEDSKILKINPDAREIFNRWYENLNGSNLTKRLDTYGHRLMALFCANEKKSKVTAEVMERVVKLLEWQQKIRDQHAPIDAEGNIPKLEELIRRKLKKGPLEKRALQKKVHYERLGLYAWENAVNNLVRAEEISVEGKIMRLSEKE